MIGVWCLLVGIAIGAVITRAFDRRNTGAPVVLFESEDFRTKIRGRWLS